MNRLLDTRLQTILLTGSLFLIYIFSMLTLSDYIDVIGSKVFSSNPLMDFQLSVILYWLFGLIFIFFPINHKTKSVIVYAYIFRFIFLHTITIGYLFLYSSDKGFSVISLDEMIYFIRGFTLGSEEFGYVGSGLITRINYIFTQFLPINFFLYRALFGLLSFAGIILIWRAISEYYEDKLFKQADFIFVTSKPLLNKCNKLNKHTYYFNNVVDIDNFRRVTGANKEQLQRMFNQINQYA